MAGATVAGSAVAGAAVDGADVVAGSAVDGSAVAGAAVAGAAVDGDYGTGLSAGLLGLLLWCSVDGAGELYDAGVLRGLLLWSLTS